VSDQLRRRNLKPCSHLVMDVSGPRVDSMKATPTVQQSTATPRGPNPRSSTRHRRFQCFLGVGGDGPAFLLCILVVLMRGFGRRRGPTSTSSDPRHLWSYLERIGAVTRPFLPSPPGMREREREEDGVECEVIRLCGGASER